MCFASRPLDETPRLTRHVWIFLSSSLAPAQWLVPEVRGPVSAWAAAGWTAGPSAGSLRPPLCPAAPPCPHLDMQPKRGELGARAEGRQLGQSDSPPGRAELITRRARARPGKHLQTSTLAQV